MSVAIPQIKYATHKISQYRLPFINNNVISTMRNNLMEQLLD